MLHRSKGLSPRTKTAPFKQLNFQPTPNSYRSSCFSRCNQRAKQDIFQCCVTFFICSLLVANHSHMTCSWLWSWMVSTWHCPHWTAENSRLSLDMQRDGMITVARRETWNVGPATTYSESYQTLLSIMHGVWLPFSPNPPTPTLRTSELTIGQMPQEAHGHHHPWTLWSWLLEKRNENNPGNSAPIACRPSQSWGVISTTVPLQLVVSRWDSKAALGSFPPSGVAWFTFQANSAR